MPSMFERTTKKLVKEIGDKNLRPVKCLERATKIRRFSLIQRKKARSRFWKLPDDPLDVSLRHILEPGSSVPDAAVKVSANFSDSMVRKQQAAVNVNAGAEAGFSEETTVCRGFSLEYQIVRTPHETLTELQKRKLLDPEPAFLKQCREAGVNLYVVADTVELLKNTVLQDLSSAKGLGKGSISLNTLVKGEGQGRGHKAREKELTMPKGSVLAYRRKQLFFFKNCWGIHHMAGDDDLESFITVIKTKPCSAAGPKDPDTLEWAFFQEILTLFGSINTYWDQPQQTRRENFPSPVPPPPHLNAMTHIGPWPQREPPVFFEYWDQTDFKLLEEEVSQKVKAAELSKGMRGVVFSNLLAMLRSPMNALQDLIDKLEQTPIGHLNGPGGTILTELRKDSRCPGGSKSLLLYLLEALIVLSDSQLDLLAQSMEKRILIPQRDLVRSILEPNFNCFQNIPFTLQPKLLAPLQGENLVITSGLLNECGLKMEPKTWDPEAKEPLSALYATLSVLTQLAEA